MDKKNLVLAGVASTSVVTVPLVAQAQTVDPNLTKVSDMVTSLGTLAGVVSTVIVGAMVVRLGIKFVNRMSVKG